MAVSSKACNLRLLYGDISSAQQALTPNPVFCTDALQSVQKTGLIFYTLHRRRSAYDLGDFFGDARLPVLVVDEGELVDQGFGVVGSRLHRDHARALLGGHVLGDRLEDDGLDVAREHLLEQDRKSTRLNS